MNKRPAASEVMRRLNADPLKYIIQQFNTMKSGDPEKLKAAYELLPYAYPKLRSIPEGEEEKNQTVEIIVGSASRVRRKKREAKLASSSAPIA